MRRWNIILLGIVGLLAISLVIAGRRSSRVSMEKELGSASAVVEGKRSPVLVELFTSEGCSSCPPADELLARLEKEQPVAGAQVIVLSQHVDYWNRLGWADPYSSAAFSERQGGYAAAFNREDVYTPQMVVDGKAEFVGSNRDKAFDAIGTAAKLQKAAIQLSRGAQSVAAESNTIPLNIRIENLPAVSAGDTAEVLLAVAESDLHSSVSRGENAGHRLSHTAVVRQLSVVGNFDAQGSKAFTAAPTISVENNWKRQNLRAVVFVQERMSRKVLGAATLDISAK
jgi:hypothetical protein